MGAELRLSLAHRSPWAHLTPRDTSIDSDLLEGRIFLVGLKIRPAYVGCI